LDEIFLDRFGTRPNLMLLSGSRFANGIGSRVNSFTTFIIWRILGKQIQCSWEFIVMKPEPERYTAWYRTQKRLAGISQAEGRTQDASGLLDRAVQTGRLAGGI